MGSLGNPYEQPPGGSPYGDQPQPWYATGTTAAPQPPPPPTGRRRRSGLRTALLIIVAVILLVCIGTVVFAATPYGSDRIERLGTWAADESTRQAVGN